MCLEHTLNIGRNRACEGACTGKVLPKQRSGMGWWSEACRSYSGGAWIGDMRGGCVGGRVNGTEWHFFSLSPSQRENTQPFAKVHSSKHWSCVLFYDAIPHTFSLLSQPLPKFPRNPAKGNGVEGGSTLLFLLFCYGKNALFCFFFSLHTQVEKNLHGKFICSLFLMWVCVLCFCYIFVFQLQDAFAKNGVCWFAVAVAAAAACLLESWDNMAGESW